MNICLYFVQVAQTYKIVSKPVDFLNRIAYNVSVIK